MVGLAVQEHLSSFNILWALVSSAGMMSGDATPQSWLKGGCNSGLRSERPIKSPNFTHVHIFLVGRLKASLTLVPCVTGWGRKQLWWAE